MRYKHNQSRRSLSGRGLKRPLASNKLRVTSVVSPTATLALFFAAITPDVGFKPLVGEMYSSRHTEIPLQPRLDRFKVFHIFKAEQTATV